MSEKNEYGVKYANWHDLWQRLGIAWCGAKGIELSAEDVARLMSRMMGEDGHHARELSRKDQV